MPLVAPSGSAERTALERIARALESVPRAAYSVPHVYPSAAPAYTAAPKALRPALPGHQLRLYVHVPFCRYHCNFCYFAVRVGSVDRMQRYVAALERELEWIPPGTPLTQLFVGGGTPTALPAELLDRLLAAVFARTTPAGSGVHTVETSPETFSSAHVDVLRRHGIGRVSMGIQSLQDDVLERVERRHTRQQALDACRALLASGLIVNVDLIYGLPQQTEESLLADLETLAACGVPALTLYSLRTNERTSLARKLGDEDRFDLARLMRWRALVKRGAEALGYTQTRWHTFKRLDSAARRHEQLPIFDEAMRGYQLGVGMSARSHLEHVVYRNVDQLDPYLQRIESGESPVEQIFPLAEEDRVTQFIARTIGDGRPLRRDAYERTFGRAIEQDFGELLQRLGAGGLVDDDGETLLLSKDGKLAYDLVMLAFYPRRAREWLAAREGRAAFLRPEVAAAS